MEYIVYCDESRHDVSKNNSHMVIGGLWLPREDKPAFTRKVRRLCRSLGLNGEIKWSKTSQLFLESYKQLVELFFQEDAIQFRAIVVEHLNARQNLYNDNDPELGFYEFYFRMLERWIEPGNGYLILLDFKQNKNASRYMELRKSLEDRFRGEALIKDLTVIDSYQSPLAQLCDLLTGAIAAAWCNTLQGPKAELANYIAEKSGIKALIYEIPLHEPCKFNIFPINVS